jgi:hypothetical protein
MVFFLKVALLSYTTHMDSNERDRYLKHSVVKVMLQHL